MKFPEQFPVCIINASGHRKTAGRIHCAADRESFIRSDLFRLDIFAVFEDLADDLLCFRRKIFPFQDQFRIFAAFEQDFSGFLSA